MEADQLDGPSGNCGGDLDANAELVITGTISGDGPLDGEGPLDGGGPPERGRLPEGDGLLDGGGLPESGRLPEGDGPEGGSPGGLPTVSVVSWNANGLRARLTQNQYGFLLRTDGSARYDVVCIQETKADEHQIKVPADLKAAYPYRTYRSTRLRKGQSGTAIWSRAAPHRQVPGPPTDVEGRVCAADFGTFVVVSVYVPNSGTKHTFRTGLWHAVFSKYLEHLRRDGRAVVVCMDANVCHENVDIYAPGKHRDKVAGFYDIERQQFTYYLSRGYRDAFRVVHPGKTGAFTWFNPRVPQMRERNLGWRLDVVLVSRGTDVTACKHLSDVRGSDHVPVVAHVAVPQRHEAAAPLSPFCTEWLRPHKDLLARLAGTCSLTDAAYRALRTAWTFVKAVHVRDSVGVGVGVDSSDCICGVVRQGGESTGAGDSAGAAEEEAEEEEEEEGAALLAFAANSLTCTEPGRAQREQTRNFFASDGCK